MSNMSDSPVNLWSNELHAVQYSGATSPTPALHRKFLATLDVRPEYEDPSNKLLDAQSQLDWMEDIGFLDADCH